MTTTTTQTPPPIERPAGAPQYRVACGWCMTNDHGTCRSLHEGTPMEKWCGCTPCWPRDPEPDPATVLPEDEETATVDSDASPEDTPSTDNDEGDDSNADTDTEDPATRDADAER